MYQVSKIKIGNGPVKMFEDEHYVVRFLAWYPAGPLKEDDATTGEREKRNRVREHDLVKFVARNGGVRCLRAADLQVL